MHKNFRGIAYFVSASLILSAPTPVIAGEVMEQENMESVIESSEENVTVDSQEQWQELESDREDLQAEQGTYTEAGDTDADEYAMDGIDFEEAIDEAKVEVSGVEETCSEDVEDTQEEELLGLEDSEDTKTTFVEDDDTPEPYVDPYPCYAGAVSLNSCKVKVKLKNAGKFKFTGVEVTPEIKVKVKVPGEKKYVELTEGADFKCTYENNIDACTDKKSRIKPTIIIHGIGNYTGEAEKEFYIKPMKMSLIKAETAKSVVRIGATTIDELKAIKGSTKKSPVQMKPVVYAYNPVTGKRIYAGYDYTYKYGKNNSSGSGTVTIKGKKNYKGSKTLSFKIEPQLTKLEELVAKYPEKVNWNKTESVYALCQWLYNNGVKDDITPLPGDEDVNWCKEDEKYKFTDVTFTGYDLGTVYREVPENFKEYARFNEDYFYDKDLYQYPITAVDANNNVLVKGEDYDIFTYRVYNEGKYTYWVRAIGLGHYEGAQEDFQFTCVPKTSNQDAKGRYFKEFFRDYLAKYYTDGTWGFERYPVQFKADHVVDDNWYDYWPAYRNSKASYDNDPANWSSPEGTEKKTYTIDQVKNSMPTDNFRLEGVCEDTIIKTTVCGNDSSMVFRMQSGDTVIGFESYEVGGDVYLHEYEGNAFSYKHALKEGEGFVFAGVDTSSMTNPKYQGTSDIGGFTYDVVNVTEYGNAGVRSVDVYINRDTGLAEHMTKELPTGEIISYNITSADSIKIPNVFQGATVEETDSESIYNRIFSILAKSGNIA